MFTKPLPKKSTTGNLIQTVRQLKIITVSLICIILLTGCKGDFSSNDKEFKKKSDEAKLSGTTITLMASEDWIKNSEMELGTNFEAATGIQVIYELYNDDEYLDTLFKRLESDNPPDIFLTQSGFAIQNTYHLNKYAVDLSSESWIGQYDSFSAKETSIDGYNYGMTYYDTTTDYYLVYNKKILKKAGVTNIPETFVEFEEMCEKISQTGVVPIYEPMADGWHQTMLFAETGQIFNQLEPGIFEQLNKNKTKFSNNTYMKQSLDQIKELATKGYFGKTYKTDTYENAVGYLASGEYAMCMLKPGAINSIINSDLNNGYKKEDFGMMILPICDNQLLNIHPTGPSHFISSCSDNIPAAKLYFEYIASKENIQYMIDNSSDIENLPFNIGQDPDYDKNTQEFLDNFDHNTSGMVLQDEVTYFNEQWGEISNNILKLCEGELTSTEVLEAIDSKRAELAIKANDYYWKK